jgi:hypothetical protein
MRPSDNIRIAAGLAVALSLSSCQTTNKSNLFPDTADGSAGAGDGAVGGGGATDASSASTDGGGAGAGGGSGTGGGSGDTDAGVLDARSCGTTRIMASSVPTNILLVIDKSGSMSDPLGSTSRWSAMKAALADALDKVKGSISFGLEFFPNGQTPAQTCDLPTGAAAIVIPIGPGTTTVPDITKAFDVTAPAGGTPTATALARAYDYFTTGAGQALTGNRFVLLATDGGPDCNGSLVCPTASCTLNLDDPKRSCGPRAPDGTAANCCDPKLPNGATGCLDDDATTTQIQQLAAAGVKTFVVGIPGTEVYAKSLDRFATAGGEANPMAPPSYFAVSASGGVAGLTSVFSAITTKLIQTCNLQLQSDPPDQGQLNVSVDGALVPPGPDGWHLDTSTQPPTIVLDGATCAGVQMHGASNVQVVYGCPTIK